MRCEVKGVWESILGQRAIVGLFPTEIATPQVLTREVVENSSIDAFAVLPLLPLQTLPAEFQCLSGRLLV